MEKEKIYKPCKHEKSCREGNMLICSDCPHGIYDLEKGIDIIENFIENHLERDKLEINEGRGGFKIGQIYKITELNPALSQLLIEYKNLKRENEDSKNIIEKYKNSDYETICLENSHLKEELEKLQDENKELKKSKYVYGIDMDFDYIPKKKIRDKIKELEDEYEDITQNSDFIIADIIQPKIKILKELLEEELKDEKSL